MRLIVDEIKQVITASSTRKREREERAKAEDFDAEEGELLKEENEQEEDVFDKVVTECSRDMFLQRYVSLFSFLCLTFILTSFESYFTFCNSLFMRIDDCFVRSFWQFFAELTHFVYNFYFMFLILGRRLHRNINKNFWSFIFALL